MEVGKVDCLLCELRGKAEQSGGGVKDWNAPNGWFAYMARLENRRQREPRMMEEWKKFDGNAYVGGEWRRVL